jgi:hypothetical protein
MFNHLVESFATYKKWFPYLWHPIYPSKKLVILLLIQSDRDGLMLDPIFIDYKEEWCHQMEDCHVFPVISWATASISACRIIGYQISFYSLWFFLEKYSYQQRDFPKADWISDFMLPLPSISKVTLGEAEYVVESIQLIVVIR